MDEQTLTDPAADTVQRLLAFLPDRYASAATVTPLDGGGLMVAWDLGGCRVELDVVVETPCMQSTLDKVPVA